MPHLDVLAFAIGFLLGALAFMVGWIVGYAYGLSGARTKGRYVESSRK